MNIDEIKKLIKNSTAVLVLDDGQPSFVVLGYEAYKKLGADRNNEEKEIKINSVDHNRSVYSNNGFDHRFSHGRMSGEMATNRNQTVPEKESEILERLNKEILALKQQIEAEEKEMAESSGLDID